MCNNFASIFRRHFIEEKAEVGMHQRHIVIISAIIASASEQIVIKNSLQQIVFLHSLKQSHVITTDIEITRGRKDIFLSFPSNETEDAPKIQQIHLLQHFYIPKQCGSSLPGDPNNRFRSGAVNIIKVFFNENIHI